MRVLKSFYKWLNQMIYNLFHFEINCWLGPDLAKRTSKEEFFVIVDHMEKYDPSQVNINIREKLL